MEESQIFFMSYNGEKKSCPIKMSSFLQNFILSDLDLCSP